MLAEPDVQSDNQSSEFLTELFRWQPGWALGEKRGGRNVDDSGVLELELIAARLSS